MYEIPREPWQDDLKMSPEVKAQRDKERDEFFAGFDKQLLKLPLPDADGFKAHVTAVLSDVLAELRIMRDSTKGSLAEQVAYELRKRAGSTGGAPTDKRTKMRRFTMFRRGDLSATHNQNQANTADDPQFEGVEFSDGTVAIRWLTPLRSTAVWQDFATMEGVHGHPEERYASELVWHDRPASRVPSDTEKPNV